MGRYQINNNIMKKLLLCILAVFILVPLSAQKMKLTKAEKRTLASAEISDFQLERILNRKQCSCCQVRHYSGICR